MASNLPQLGNRSGGNFSSSGEFHMLKTNHFILPTSGGTASDLDHYEEFTYTGNLTGALTSAYSWQVVRVGNVVTVYIIGASAASAGNATITTDTSLPASLRPNPANTNTFWPLLVTDNSVEVLGNIAVTAGGDFVIGVGTVFSGQTPFNAAGTAGFAGTAISYVV